MASEPEKSSSGVQVSCRLRGLSCTELAAGRRDAVFVDPEDPHGAVSVLGAAQTFRFDHVFSTSATQEEIFTSVGEPCLRNLLAGYNCTLLAYGQTGSGKTYTTIGGGGDAVEGSHKDRDGLVPRLLEQLFDAVAHEPDTMLTASFIEVYQERLRDLLVRPSSSSSSSSLRIREDKIGGGGVWVDGATEISLLDLATARATLRCGLAHRSVGATRMNRDSSRSHAVFAVTLTRRTSTGESVRARLCVVDLAGSEQAKKTHASGTRLDEAKYINRSLSALGNVIHALTSSSNSPTSGPSYVPYRDSKLTRLLQSSLGGNAKTHLLITCTSACCHTDESLSTLRFGARASRVRNKPTVNLNTTTTVTATSEGHQRELLETLQQKLESLCRYIRELEAAAAVTTLCQCGLVLVKREENTSVLPVSSEEDPAGDPGDEDADTPISNVPLSSDLLMHAELLTLRTALEDLQRLQHHEQSLQEAVNIVEHDEVEKLHERQARDIERLDAQLTLTESEIASLQLQLREQLYRESQLKQKLTQYESLERRGEDAASAESEILRRRLEHSEKQLKMLQLELVSIRAEAAEMQLRVERGERDLVRLENELHIARLQLQELPPTIVASPLPSPLPPSASPPRGKPTLLRPVTVAAPDRSGISTTAIQSWWAGETTSTNNREEPARDDEGLQEHHSLGRDSVTPLILGGGLTAGSASRCRTGLASGRPRLDALATTDLLLRGETRGVQEDCDRKQQLHSSGGARPFRARLVGLLSSLEAETSSYKELLHSTGNATSTGEALNIVSRPRPAHPRSHTRHHRLPELEDQDHDRINR